MAKRPHLSPSAIDLYLKCPEAYRRRYQEHERIPPGIAMLRGTAYHAVAATNFRQKLETHEDLPAADLMDQASEAINNARRGEWLHPAAAGDPGRAWAEAKDDTVNAAAVFAEKVAPDYQPILVEEFIRIEIPGASHDMLGIIDLIDDQHRVSDHKTAGRAKSASDVETSLQLTFYAAAHRARFKSDPTEVRLDVVTTGGKRQVLSSTRDRYDYARLAGIANIVLRAIDAGIFPPAKADAWWCNQKWCGYFDTCPYVRPAPAVHEIKLPEPAPEPEPAEPEPDPKDIGPPAIAVKHEKPPRSRKPKPTKPKKE